jgi:hypothetical protein
MGTVGWVLAIAGTWVLASLVLAGCGFAARAVLVRFATGAPAGAPRLGDVWIGLAALLAYLLLWSLVLPLEAATWIAPALAAAAGLAAGARRLRRPHVAPGAAVLVAVSTLLLADQALGPAQNYDVGLYHAEAVSYDSHFAAIPGLANLLDRLGSGDAHLLLVGLLDQGPWAGAGIHLANGLLVSLLVADLAVRVGRGDGFTSRTAALLLPATFVVVAWSPGIRLASPDLDAAALALVFAGAVQLAEAVERGPRPAPALTAVAAFACAAVTRPLYWLWAVLACATLVALWRRREPALPTGRGLLLLGPLPALLAVGWLARQSILSGYPLYPLPLGGLPVGWRVPRAAVENLDHLIRSWAHWAGPPRPGRHGLLAWVGPWLRVHFRRDLEIVAPLALLAAIAPFVPAGRDSGRAARRAPLLALLLPSLLLLALWFVEAPEPRFAYAPLWLAPVALTAWALPEAPGDRGTLLLLAAGSAAALAAVASGRVAWFLPAAAAVWIAGGLAVRVLAGAGTQAWVAHVAVGSVLVAAVLLTGDHVARHGLVRATTGGVLGTAPLPRPVLLESFTTSSGLRLTRPPPPEDRCWGVELCTPNANPALRLRGRGVGGGFSVRPPGA